MAITITGGKYSAASVSSVGTTTVTVSTTPFVSGDFAVPRRVDLFNSAGTTFKGTAFVRQWNSTSQLQLETQFFDPKTGDAVTQVVGDTVLVSKNFAECVTAGLSVSGNVVTISDTITFGTSGTVNSLALHDEDKFVTNTVGSASARMYDVAGGFLTFGHLQDYASKKYYAPCSFTFGNAPSSYGTNSFSATSTAARLCIFGGSHVGSAAFSLYFGCGSVSWAPYGTDWAFLWCLEVAFNATDVVSKGAGGAWTTGSDHVIENCKFVGAGTNQILARFGNGLLKGGDYKILRNSSSPLAVFGSDIAGTYALGSPADSRAVVLDMGTSNVLWTCGAGNLAQTLNITNLISTDYRAGYFATPEVSSATNATKNIYFQDSYANLRDLSGLAVIRDSDWSVDSSGTASGASSTVALTAFHSTGTGHSLGSQRGPWTYRIRKYGYDEIEGAIAESAYSLGTAGTAFNVAFGGFVNQIARASLTDSEATALAYAGITVTDHGASPVSWNSKSWSISVTVDLATYPSRTAAQVFAHLKAGIAKTATFNGKSGLLWHVLMEESGSGYISQRGKSGGAGASLKGVRIIDQAGNPLPDVISMTADDGSIYTPPTADVRGLSFANLIAGSTLRVFDTGTTTELFATTSSGTSEVWSESASGSRTVDYTVLKDGYIPIRVTGVTVTGAVSGGVLSTPIQQQVDRSYQTPSGLAIGTTATINAGTKRVTVTVATTVQNWYSYMVQCWRTETALRNVAFPFSTNGPNSFQLGDGWQFSSGVNLLSRDGMRWVNSSGVVTDVWAALLSVGVPAGKTVRYEQTDGGTVQSAAATGNIDQLVKIYQSGSFDYTGWLVLKVQGDGYDQAEFNAISTYGTLEDQLYVVGLTPSPNGIASGSVTGVTITDHGASPVTWNSKTYSITITDTTGHTGEQIVQYVRGLNDFDYHDLVQTNGTEFKTVRGVVYGDVGASLKGVRVVKADGTTPHDDFNLHTADDGTTYVPPLPPAAAEATILANSRVQLYNVTTDTEIDNVFVTGTSYSYVVTTEASLGDTLRLRVCALGKESGEAFGIWNAGGLEFLVSQPADAIYDTWGIDGSAVTEFSGDVTGHIYIDANDLDGVSTKTRLGAWYSWVLTTEIGIRHFFGAVTYVSSAAIRVNVDIADMLIENINASAALRFTDLSVRLYRSDGSSIIAPTSYSIHNDYSGVPDVVETGVSGLTGAESAQLMGLPNSTATAAAVISSMCGARSLSEHLQAQSAVLLGDESGSGTTHITFTDGSAVVEADVPLPGEVGNRTNVTISV